MKSLLLECLSFLLLIDEECYVVGQHSFLSWWNILITAAFFFFFFSTGVTRSLLIGCLLNTVLTLWLLFTWLLTVCSSMMVDVSTQPVLKRLPK